MKGKGMMIDEVLNRSFDPETNKKDHNRTFTFETNLTLFSAEAAARTAEKEAKYLCSWVDESVHKFIPHERSKS